MSCYLEYWAQRSRQLVNVTAKPDIYWFELTHSNFSISSEKIFPITWDILNCSRLNTAWKKCSLELIALMAARGVMRWRALFHLPFPLLFSFCPVLSCHHLQAAAVFFYNWICFLSTIRKAGNFYIISCTWRTGKHSDQSTKHSEYF